MRTKELLEKLRGIQTLNSIKSALRVDASKATYYIHRLRKKGYVKTKYSPDKKRIYYIGTENLLKGTSYIDMINKYSPVKISSSEVHKIYGRKIPVEEALVYAIKTRKLRYILASLILFRRIKNWSNLYQLAKKNNSAREVGALYELASKKIRKIRKMPKRFRNLLLPKKRDRHIYIIPRLKSADYKDIEKKWKVYLPFNEPDLKGYEK